MSNLDIDSRYISLTTAHPPADNTSQLPDSSHLTHQGTSTIPLASILALLTTSTDEPRVKNKVMTKSGLLQLPLTVKVSEDRKIHLLENMLIGASLAKCILAPSTDPAPLACKVLEGIRKTDWGDVSIPGKVNKPINLDDSNVIVEVARVIFWMNLKKEHY